MNALIAADGTRFHYMDGFEGEIAILRDDQVVATVTSSALMELLDVLRDQKAIADPATQPLLDEIERLKWEVSDLERRLEEGRFQQIGEDL